MSFADQVKAWADKAERNIETAVGLSTDLMLQTVIRDTPVDTGHLQSMWAVSINGEDVQFLNQTQQAFKPGDQIQVVNRTPYAMRVNYGFVGTDSLGRKYNQPPRLFMEASIGLWQSVVASAALQVKQ